jgi:hypothetical protein
MNIDKLAGKDFSFQMTDTTSGGYIRGNFQADAN